MGRRDKARVRAIRFGLETSIALQRQLDTIQSLSETYGGELVADVIRELQDKGPIKPFWGGE